MGKKFRPRSGEEVFDFMYLTFNVTKAKEFISKVPREVSRVSINDLKNWFPSDDDCILNFNVGINKQYAMTTNCDSPGIVAYVNLRERVPVLIDGWHRAYKAYKDGRSHFDVYPLTDEESDSITFGLR